LNISELHTSGDTRMINVTKSFIPPSDEFMKYVAAIMERGWLTNQGPYVLELESQLKQYLGSPYLNFVSNGTIALLIAIRTLNILEGEIITTPFSYVATISSILWERCKPVFVDIETNTFCIDASKIEAAITSNTRAIMGVHVYGYPCNIKAIDFIAQKHNLPVIYDGAQAFASNYLGRSLLSYGAIATCSFHATKLFHTIEGGAVITHNQQDFGNVSLMLRFGHNNDDHIQLGINAKNSELHAAMGLCNLKYVPEIIASRKAVSEEYDRHLAGIVGRPVSPAGLEYNYSYFPILLEDEAALLSVREALNKKQIFPRRYFYPSLNLLPYLSEKQNCPVSEDVAFRVLCLPLYADLPMEAVELISSTVKEAIS
jgi:dTDP-4-amino-4,6-dideoxygalactose transaminase